MINHRSLITSLLYTVCFTFLFTISLQAQKITGTVLDSGTGQSLPFVNIIYGANAGTISDINGEFTIQDIQGADRLQFSCLGYRAQTVILDQMLPVLYVEMDPLQYELGEINVLPRENPAIQIMRKVMEHSHEHNPKLYPPYSCIIYHKMILEYNLPKEIADDELPKLMNDLGLSKDSYLMLFESVSEKRHFNKDLEKERILSGRVSGMQNPTLASLPALLQPFSFYDQYVRLLDKNYLNPVSKAGLNYYHYQLLDTITTAGGDTLYYLSYMPLKNLNFRGLVGTFHIDRNAWAIKAVEARTSGDMNGLNLYIRQNYQADENGMWFPSQLESQLELGNVGSSGQLPYPLIGKGKSYVTAINTEPGFTARDFDNITFEDASPDRSSPEVARYRYQPLTARDSLTYQLLDSLGRKAHLDAILDLQMSLVKGYIPAGKLQLDLRKLIDYNDYEGFKLGMGLSTSPRISKAFSTGGYATYGFGDKQWKYGGHFALTPFTHEENQFIIDYKDDVFATGEFSFIDGVERNSAETFKGFLTETMDRTREIKAGSEFRFLKYFKSGIYFRSASVSPQMPYLFMHTDQVSPEFDFNEVSVKLRWAHGETFTKSSLGLLSEGTPFPRIWLNATIGQYRNDKTSDYKKLETQIEKTFNYPNAMYTNIRLQGGKLLGNYPNTFLYSALGSYKKFTIFVPNTFATMRLNEFAADQFSAVYLTHGIPLLLNTNKRIKPEIVLLTNMAWSNAMPEVSTFEKGYYESGLYLKNLFSNFIFQYGLSAHYRYGAYQLDKGIDNWAFKLALEFNL